MPNEITLNRNDLYGQVWAKPMSRLAPEYGLSGNGLKKICKKLNVPVPPRGYWAKIKYGIRIKKIKLPKLKNGAPEKYTLQSFLKRSYSESLISPFSPEAEDLIQAETKKYRAINVPAQLASPLPIIRQTRKKLKEQQVDDYGVVRSWGEEHLNIRVSPKQITRALKIMNTLIKCLDVRGFIVAIKNAGKLSALQIEILNEKLKVTLEEKVRRIDHVLTEKEKKEKERESYFYAPKWDFIPTGTLTIRIDEYWAQGKRKSWRDTPKQKLEHLLNDFILGAIKVADCLKKERLEREEQHRIWEEDRRLRAEAELQRRMELERRQELENQSLAWKKSQIIRNFINTVEQTAAEEPDIIAKKDQVDAWLKWAHQHADRLDPLLKGFPFLSHPEEPNESY